MSSTCAVLRMGFREMPTMRSSVYRHTGSILSPMGWIAAASFIAGFGGFLLFGLGSMH